MNTSSEDMNNFPTGNDRAGSSKSLVGTAIELETSSAPVSRASSSHSLLGIQIDDDDDNLLVRPEVRQDDTTPRANNNSPAPPARPKALTDEGREHSTSSTSAPARPPRGPPRAPSLRAPMASSPPQKSRRKLSDAMSDVSLDSDQGHSRNVSWDMNMMNQPPPVLSIGAGSSLSSGQGKISLADIRGENPIGDEAEATILRSIEARQRQSQSPFGLVGESGMLQHVPADAHDAFVSDSIEQVRSSDTMESARTPNGTRTMRKKSSGGSSLGGEGKKPHRRLRSVANKVMKQNNEGELTGFNQLLKQMQASDHDDDVPPPPPGDSGHRLRTQSRDTIGTPASPRASGDTYLHNADLLFRRASVPKLGEPSPRGSPRGSPEERRKELRADAPKSRWNAVVTDVLRNKRNEEQPEVSSGVAISDGLGEDMMPPADVEMGGGYPPSDEEPQKGGKGKKNPTKKTRGSIFSRAKNGVEDDLKGLSDFLSLRKQGIYYYLRIVVFVVILPCIGIAAIMYYLADNPGLGRVCEVEECATISWFIIYLARCAVTFTLAKAAELFVIDYLSLRARVTVKLLGPLVTLAIVQSKGFPFLVSMWGVFNFLLLSGRHRFAMHWLFFQKRLHLFNEQNPAGTITSSRFNYIILACAVCFGIFVSVKRFVLGNYFGKRMYVRYGEQLTTLMKKIVLISKVSSHAKRIERMGSQISIHHDLFDYDRGLRGSFDTADSDIKKSPSNGSTGRRRLSTADISAKSSGKLIDPAQREMYTKSLARSQKQRIMDVLGAWEEPEADSGEPVDTSITAMLEFRQALTFMDTAYPFSVAFGPADRREACIESAQLVYERLRIHQQEGEVLSFDTIAELAMDENDELDTDKLKEYVRLFRPDRAGKLTMVEFISSVDAVYKEMRLLRASIVNSGQLDRASEAIFNTCFYILAACIILAAVGLSPLALFFSFSSIILAFAFMIGSASAKYFEGILFILLRRPYDIGDRIHISGVNDSLTINGTMTWFVEKIDLYTTTVRLAATNEVATYSNGSLASSRVINAARSPKVIFHHLFKFGVDVEYTKVQLFRDTITNFVKDRPREYIAVLGFRATRVDQELGFIEYILSVQHRESWQNMGPVLDSKSNLASFGLEVAKKLDMRYRAPPLPVNLAMVARQQENQSDDQSISHVMDSPNPGMMPDVGAIAALFEPKKDK